MKWRMVGERAVFVVGQGVVMTTGRKGLFYLRTHQEYDYLYNTALELVIEEAEIKNSRMAYERYEVGQKNAGGRERSKSRHKKLLE